MGYYRAGPQETTYLFIDGGYLKRVQQDFIRFRLECSDPVSILPDFSLVKLSSTAKRVFYYEAEDSEKRENESTESWKKRLNEQAEFFEGIGALPGFHVRTGTISGEGKKRRQKQVDVQLAVDMMNHAFHRNMSRAVLLAGDLDFKPVVTSLVMMGTYVELLYWPKSTSSELRRAADDATPITLETLHGWQTDKFKDTYPCPRKYIGESTPDGPLLRTGSSEDGTTVLLSQREGSYQLKWAEGSGLVPNNLHMEHADLRLLERWATEQYGKITWGDDAPPGCGDIC